MIDPTFVIVYNQITDRKALITTESFIVTISKVFNSNYMVPRLLIFAEIITTIHNNVQH